MFAPTVDLMLTLLAGLLAGAALFAAAQWMFFPRRADAPKFDPNTRQPATFLFDDRFLLDTTLEARNFLARHGQQADWQGVLAALAPSFPELAEKLAALPRGQSKDFWSLEGVEPAARLTADWRNEMLRLRVVEANESEVPITMESQIVFEMERDLALLGMISEQAPILMWRTQGDTGEVTWASRKYIEAARAATGREDLMWPLPRLLSEVGEGTGARRPGRAKLAFDGNGSPGWYEVTNSNIGIDTLHFAVPADTAVKAEGALREFVQTLAKTFAHLPIGLAIFNHERRLILFNPALTDLSRLPADFLSARPVLSSFLDELRNRQIMPEPKDYTGWRQMLTALEDKAVEGTYEEVWTLPEGLTYRVSGRPHPGGAIALLFEDITHEVSVSRRLRQDAEIGQSVLDTLDQAIAVFSGNGVLLVANEAFASMWNIDPAATLGEISINDCVKIWIELAEPSPAWGDARDFVSAIPGERAEWHADACLKDGRPLECQFRPMQGGETMISFSLAEHPTPLSLQDARRRASELAD